MKMMKVYHNLYLKYNVLLLANLLKNFRNNSLNIYELCPGHLSTPPLSWDAMLNMTNIELELISGAGIYFFFEKGMKGGVIWLYDFYVFLSTKGFTWNDHKNFDSNKYSSNSSKGYVLKMDLQYPKKLNELHNDHPLAPDKIEIKKEMFSRYQVMLVDFYNTSIGYVKNLMPKLF